MADVLVLCYHAVSPTWTAPLAVTPEDLRTQLTGLVRQGWRGAKFRDAVLDPPAARTLAVTFDDAFLSVLQRALPILAKLDLPGTVFAPTAFTGRRQRLQWAGIDEFTGPSVDPELECMSWEDLAHLVACGWEVGSHTRTHPRLTHLDDAALATELTQSRRDCDSHLRSPCESIAYPYGDVDDRVARLAGAAGYRCGASLSSRLAARGPLRWPRVGVYHDDPAWRFRLKVSGVTRRIRATPVWPAHE